ncbi:MAG: LysR family transcriptional regulator [Janthinobacterium lividum]
MDPDYLIFTRIVEDGSLSAAGRAMAISPAMISKRLARLEARLGVRLIHRTTRKLTLTEAGARFHGDLVTVLTALRGAESRLTGARDEPAGVLRLSAPTSFGRLHVTPHLHRFLARYPRVELEIDLSDDEVDLFAGRFDVAIRIASVIPASLAAHRLASSRRVLCASPAYLAEHLAPASVADLSRHRLLAATGQLPWRLVNGRLKHTVDGPSHVRTNSSEVVRELALTGVGIALRSLWDVDAALAERALVPVLPDWTGPADLAVHAVHPRGPSTAPVVAAMIAFLQEAFETAPWDRAATQRREVDASAVDDRGRHR